MMAFLGLICLFLNANILINKSDISELEKEQMVANVIQNIDKIKEIKEGADHLNENPFPQKEGIGGFDDLDIGFNQKQSINNIQHSQKLFDSNNTKTKITVIGDSVTLGARKSLTETLTGSHVDAKGSRSIADGYDLMKNMQNSNTLSEYVVIALGTNGCENWNLYIDKIIAEFSTEHRLIFVTPYDGSWNETWKSYKTTQYLREINEKYTSITIAD